MMLSRRGRELFITARIGIPAWTRRTVGLALVGVVALSVVISPGVSMAAKVFTFQKAAKISLGNTVAVTVSGAVSGSNDVEAVTMLCPPGHQALNGGADSNTLAGADPNGFPWLIVSTPVAGGSRSIGWYVEVFESGSGAHTFTAYAVCAP